jgi:hypothetical protein
VPIVLAAAAYGLVLVGLYVSRPLPSRPSLPSPGRWRLSRPRHAATAAAVPVTRRRSLCARSSPSADLARRLRRRRLAHRHRRHRHSAAPPRRPPVDDFGVTPRVTLLDDFYVVGKDLPRPRS